MSYAEAPSLLALAVIILSACTGFVTLRALSRRLQPAKIGIDDAAMFMSWLLTVVMCINMLVAVSTGRWGLSLPPRADASGEPDLAFGQSPELAQSEMFAWIQELLFPLQLMFAKLSVLLFYRRLLVVKPQGTLHWTTFVCILVTICWGITMFFLFLFQCGTDFSLPWNGPLELEAEVCLPAELELVMAGSDALLDLIIFFLPMRRILSLELSPRKKLAVIGAFGIGASAVVVSTIRIGLYTPLDLGIVDTAIAEDENLTVSAEMFLGLLEAGLAVVTACLPSLQWLVVVHFGRQRRSIVEKESERQASV